MDLGGLNLQGGIVGLLGVVITVLLGVRLNNKVGNDNKRENRASRFEENIQARYDAALATVDQLNRELLIERDRRETQSRRIKERDFRIMNLLEEIERLGSKKAREDVERWMPESTFAPLDERPRKR